MKKTLILFVSLVALFSCESDDITQADPIIGSWSFTSKKLDGVEQLTSQCYSTMTYASNGTYTSDDSALDAFGVCVVDANSIVTGTWVNNGYSVYVFDNVVNNPKKYTFSGNNYSFLTGDGHIVNTYTRN